MYKKLNIDFSFCLFNSGLPEDISFVRQCFMMRMRPSHPLPYPLHPFPPLPSPPFPPVSTPIPPPFLPFPHLPLSLPTFPLLQYTCTSPPPPPLMLSKSWRVKWTLYTLVYTGT